MNQTEANIIRILELLVEHTYDYDEEWMKWGGGAGSKEKKQEIFNRRRTLDNLIYRIKTHSIEGYLKDLEDYKNQLEEEYPSRIDRIRKRIEFAGYRKYKYKE